MWVPPRSSTFAPFAFSVGAVEMSKLYAIVATTKGEKKNEKRPQLEKQNL